MMIGTWIVICSLTWLERLVDSWHLSYQGPQEPHRCMASAIEQAQHGSGKEGIIANQLQESI